MGVARKEQMAAAAIKRPPAVQRGTAAAPSPARALQQRMGNRGTQAFIEVRQISRVPQLQSKLAVSTPGDQFEREADRVAGEVMRMIDPSPPEIHNLDRPPMQRMCSGCENEAKDAEQTTVQRKCGPGAAEEEREVQRKGEGDAPAAVMPDVANVRGRGAPLSPPVRAFFEPRFGRDLSAVRVHDGAEAASAAHSVHALAYTVGTDIVFGAGQYEPSSEKGRQLLAHELTHTIQQRGDIVRRKSAKWETGVPRRIGSPSDALEREAGDAATRVHVHAHAHAHVRESAAGLIQRDLATPPPAVAPPAQAALTAAQIQSAIRFNTQRYNSANTRLIQDLISTEQTGVWSVDNITAIAESQAEYGLASDGKVGNETFRFLNNEQRLEGMSSRTADCLTAFGVTNFGSTGIVRDAVTNTCTLSGHFRTAAQFSTRCNCSQFEYRQFIRGHVLQNRGGVQVADIGATQFGRLPARALTAAFNEDGDITDPTAQNYGHRANPADAMPEDHYIDDTGADDQANGCRYHSEDVTGFANVPGIPDCRVGDVIDADMTYRGDIERNGTRIQSRQWSAIRARFTVR